MYDSSTPSCSAIFSVHADSDQCHKAYIFTVEVALVVADVLILLVSYRTGWDCIQYHTSPRASLELSYPSRQLYFSISVQN